ncbi:MAG: F0F1 ATP synthase subunit A [Limimaricola sp.]|uniref:F0F1 ATP synthase subunit A n=1 Tax=Limimaricola sp. TaxID=2211665 RepID=UPI001D603701|nr:F0F1 ATP synthase subunit A [Limimaricola sp.]MBI1418206.1 F0F1 ATP synthase subunit A [Limimaricola sp.]
MIASPLTTQIAFMAGPVPVSTIVVTTWAVMAVLLLGAVLIGRHLRLIPGPAQAVAELLVEAIDDQIAATVEASPAPYRVLIGTLFIFIFTCNWSSLVPGVEPPTAHLETDAALAALVFVATVWHGLRAHGPLGYLRTFAQPSWVMIPLNLVEQLTRTLSLTVRLFGNVMSGVFVIGIIGLLAGLLVPIPLMALDMLTGAVQAYIFAVLAMVFIAAAVSEGHSPRPAQPTTPATEKDSP